MQRVTWNSATLTKNEVKRCFTVNYVQFFEIYHEFLNIICPRFFFKFRMIQTKRRTTYNKQIQQKSVPEAKARSMKASKQSNRK